MTGKHTTVRSFDAALDAITLDAWRTAQEKLFERKVERIVMITNGERPNSHQMDPEAA